MKANDSIESAALTFTLKPDERKLVTALGAAALDAIGLETNHHQHALTLQVSDKKFKPSTTPDDFNKDGITDLLLQTRSVVDNRTIAIILTTL